MGISNGNSRPITSGTVLDMSDALTPFLEPLSLIRITKAVADAILAETQAASANFTGVIQPLSTRELALKPEDQRAWRWKLLLSDRNLVIELDDIVVIKGTPYRCLRDADWSSYGVFNYHLVEDYGPGKDGEPAEQVIFVADLQMPGNMDYDTSSSPIDDARVAIWKLLDRNYAEVIGAVQVLSESRLRLTVPAAGTYRLMGDDMAANKHQQTIDFDGEEEFQTIDVSADMPDARQALWALYAPDGTTVEGAVQPTSAAEISVGAQPALPEGTYQLVGLS